MSSGNQKTDFNYVKDVIDGLIKTLNFRIKNKNFPQIWKFGSGKNLAVKKFAEIIWKKLNPTSKLMFSNKVVSDKTDYKVDNKKLWKINYTHQSNTV